MRREARRQSRSSTATGDEITVADLEAAVSAIDYQIQPLDIVLIRTDASKNRFSQAYLTDHPGMTRDGTLWLVNQGVKLIGIDAIGFDPPVKYMFERQHLLNLLQDYLERKGRLLIMINHKIVEI